MTYESFSNYANRVPLPDFFEADPNVGEQTAHAPVNLIDAFYIRPHENGPTTFIGVVGNTDGSLQTIVNESTLPLSGSIPEQVEAIRVAQRGIFRGITTDRVSVIGITAVEQNIATRGFNDPVVLYGDLAMATLHGPENDNATQRGRMVVGRLDFLQAYRAGLNNAFRSVNPDNANASIVPLLLPVGSAESGQRKEVVLAYPIFDPTTIEFGDNGIITRYIVYDLLVRLQRDLIEEGLHHPLITYELPVPSRRRLEAELTVDGYRIEGNQAVCTNGQHKEPAKGLLGRLRQMTQDWAAERITLPPEATDADYAAIIDEIMPAILTPHDRAIASLASSMVAAQVAYTKPRPVRSSISSQSAIPTAQSHLSRQPQHPTVATTHSTRNADTAWNDDFATPPAPPLPRQKAREQWERDFDIVSHMPLHQPASTPTVETGQNTPADWLQDFTGKECVAQERRSTTDWDGDFTEGLPAPLLDEHVNRERNADWDSDFS